MTNCLKSLLAVVLVAGSSNAADIVWTNTAGGNWSTAANWSPNQVPGSGDNALITTSGAYTVTVNSPATVGSLQVGGGTGARTLALSSTLTINGASSVGANGIFDFSSGVLNGAGDLTVGGALIWGSGNMSGSGKTTIANGATLTVNNTTHDLLRTLQNDGSATWTAGALQMNGGVLNNNGTFTVTTAGTLQSYGTGGANAFNNTGTFVKQGAGALNFTVSSTGVSFNNTGSVDIQAGPVSFSAGGSNSGSIALGTGTSLSVSGAYTHEATSTVNGAGTLNLSGGSQTFAVGAQVNSDLSVTGATVNFASNVTLGDVTFASGTLTGTGDITITNSLTWGSGTMSGAGKTIIANGATLTINNTTHDLLRTLQNDGTGTWTAGALQMNGGVFNNNGTLTITTTGTLQTYGTGGANSFNNAGSLVKEGSGALNFTVSSTAVALSNNGLIDIKDGTVTANGGGSNGSTILIAAGSAFNLNGSYTHTISSILNGLGTLNITGGTHPFAAGAQINAPHVNVNGGTVNIAGNISLPDLTLGSGALTGTGDVTVSGSMTWGSGTMSGSGRTIIANTATLAINNTTHDLNRTLQNDGTATWTAGAIQMNGGTLINNGTFTANSGSNLSCYGTGGANVFNNSGGFTKQGAGTINFTVSSTAASFNNSGTVDLQGGILALDASGAHTGDFAIGNGATLRFGGTHTLTAAADITGAGSLNVANGSMTDAGIVNIGGATFSGGTVTFNNTFDGGAALTISGGTVNFNGATTFANGAAITLAGGTLSGSGDITVTGNLVWGAGVMSGAGKTTIANGATLTMDNTTHDLNRTLQNDGTATWTAGAFQMNGGTFINNGSFTANSGGNLSCYGTGGTTAFNNAGAFTKQGAGTISFTVSSSPTPFNNTGTVNVQTGILGLDASGAHTGDFTVAAGATLRLNGAHTLSPTADTAGAGALSVTGGNTTDAGSVNIGSATFSGGSATFNNTFAGGSSLTISGGTANFNGTTSFAPGAAISLSGGVLGGSGDVTVTGALLWSGGVMAGGGRTIIGSGATLTINNTTHDLNRRLDNNGTATWTAGAFQMNAGTFNNNGNFTADTTTTLSCYGTGGANVFNNIGTFTKQGTGTISFSVSSTAAAFNNSGAVAVPAGTLTFNGGFTQTAGQIVLSGGGLSANSAMQIQGGVVSGPGVITGSINNTGGTISPGASPGLLTITGNYTQGAGGTLNIELAGAVAVTGFDQIIVNGTATLGGALNVTLLNGFKPLNSSSFTFLTAGTRTGAFSTFNYPAADTSLQLTYSGTSATIQESTIPFTPTIFWVGGAGDWNTVTNWNTGVLPGPTDDVLINVQGDVVVTHSSGSHNARSLFSQNAIVLSGGSLTVSNTLQVNNGLLMQGGALRGATVLPGTGGQGIVATTSAGTLDGVTMNGELDVGRLNSGAVVTVTNGMQLNGTLYVGNSTNQAWGQVGFSGNQTLSGNGTVVFGNQGACNALRVDLSGTTLTIGPAVTVRGHSGQIGQSTSCIGGPANVAVVNQGTIKAEISGGTITIRAQTFTNQAVIQALTGATVSIDAMQNTATGQVSTTGGTLSLGGSWDNAGAINTTNATVNLGGSSTRIGSFSIPNSVLNIVGNFTTAQIEGIQYSAGAVRLGSGGLVDNTTDTLTLNAATGSWQMNGGTLRNGVVSESGGAQLVFGTGTLDGVTVNGDVDVGRQNSGANMTALHGLTLNGTLYLGNPTNQAWGQVGFTGSQTLGGNGSIVFGNQGACNALRVDTGGATLTIGPGLTVRGFNGQIGHSTSCIGSPANVSIVNQGAISADVSGGTINILAQSFTNEAVVQALNGATLAIDSLQNSATGQASATGGTLTLNGPWSNAGVINGTSATVNLGGSSSQVGNFAMLNSTLNIFGTFTTAQIEGIQNSSGAIRLNNGGVIDNSGHTMVLNETTGSLLMNGGTLRNGVLNESGGAQLVFGTGTLDGMTVNGDLDVGRQNSGANMTVMNGLVLNGTMYLGNPTNQAWGQVGFVGTQTLSGNGTVVFGNQGSCNAMRVDTGGTTLTIAPTINIHGHSGQIGHSTACIGSPANVSVINQGTISADVINGTIILLAQNFINQGTLQVVTGAAIGIDALLNDATGQVLAAGGTLTLNGNWSNSGLINAANATVNLGGSSTQTGNFSAPGSDLNFTGAYTTAQIETIQYSPDAVRVSNGSVIDNTGHTLVLNGATGSWRMNGGTLRNGLVSTSGGALLIFGGATLDGVTVNGDLDVGRQNSGANMIVANGLALNGTLYLGNPTNQAWGQVGFVGSQTLVGNGTVVFGNQGTCNALRVDTVAATLSIGANIKVRGHSGVIGYSNSCIGSPASVNIVNLGTITADASGGTITIRAQNIANQGIVDAQRATVAFVGDYTLATGTLSVGISGLTDYGRITFNNPVTMQGTLKAHFNGAYRPASGSSFTLLTYPSRTGNFDLLDLPADVQWQSTNGPTEFAITGTGLLELPSIVTAPQSQSIVVGTSATFSASALGTQPLGYRWQRNGVNLTDSTHISGAATTTLTINNVISTDAGDYRVVVTNAFGTATSVAAKLTPLCIVSASNNPTDAGNIVGIGVFAAGNTNVLTANPRAGYKFANWTEGGTVVGATASLTTILTTNHVFVANYTEANPLHVVTTATLPAGLATLAGAGTYSNGQSFAFSAPLNITNPPNLFTFKEWRANGALVSSIADFTKTFVTQDPTNLQFVAHYNAATILPLVTNVTINFAQPVPATTNLQLSVQFNRSMDTNFTPLIVLSNGAAGSVQPTVNSAGTWSAVTAANDTYTPPPITLAAGMDGTNNVVVSLARDLSGSQLAPTNVFQIRVDVTAPAAPTLSLTSSNNSSVTVSWSGYTAPADIGAFRLYLSPTNFTSVAGRAPVSGVAAGARQFAFGGLTLDQQYYAAVAAVDVAGNSSPTVTALPFSLPSSTPPPVTIQVQAVGPSSANVTWNNYDTTSLLGFAGFKVYYETTDFTSVNGLTPKQTLAASIRSVRIDDLDRTHTYHFAIIGFNGNNGFNPNVATASWSDPLAGNISVNMVVGSAGETVDILQNITVMNNAVLTVAAGSKVRFTSGTSLTIQQGALNAIGTALDPIIFTSSNDQTGSTPAAGDWNGITLGSGAGSSTLRHVFVNFAKDVTISNCAPTVDAFTTLYNSGAGLNLLGTATLTTSNALLAFNSFGARQSNSGQLKIQNSVIKNNGTNAIAGGSASLVATQNWWGTAISGDIDVTIQGSVPHANFLTSEPLLTPAIGTPNNVTQTGTRNVNLRLACRTADTMRLSEDSTFAGVFFTPFTNSTTFQLSDGGGAKAVFAQFRSVTGQTSAPVNVTITYITAGPTIAVFNLTEGQVLTRPLLVTGNASAPLGMASMEFYVDNIGNATNIGGALSQRFDLRNLTAGVHRVKLLARDNAGNFATLERNVVITPVPPPAPSITDPVTDISVNTDALRVAGTAEPLIEVRLFRGGTILGVTNASAAGTFSFANVPLIEGGNQFSALAIDPLGNAGSPIRTVFRDTVPPVAPIFDAPVYTYGSGLTLTWHFPTTGKRGSTFQVFWHTSAVTSTNQATGHSLRGAGSQVTLQGLATGNYYFYIVAFDDVGNASPLSTPVQYLYDAAPPSFTASYDKPSPVGVGPLQVTLTSSKPISGTPSVTVQLTGTAPTLLPVTNTAINTFEGVINVSPAMPSGPVALNVSATDTAGNPFNGAPSGAPLSIDVTPPSGAITTSPISPVQATNDTPVAITLRLTEAPKVGTAPTLNFAPPVGASVPVTMTGGGTNWTGTLAITPAMDSGLGHFTLTVNDALDNVGHNITSGSALEIYNTALPAPPSQPVGFQATSLSGGRVQLTWLSVSNAEIYRVYSASGTNLVAPTTLVADNISSNTFIDLPPADGSYRYVVTALRRGSEGTNSIVRVAQSDRTPPPAPTNVSLQLVAAGLRVSWQAAAGESADHYSVYRNGVKIRTAPAGTTLIVDNPPRGIMNYTVAAADALGNEALSAAASIELLVGAVDNLQALVNVGSAPVLSWTSNDPTAVGFNVYRNGIKQNAAPLTGTSFTDALPPAGNVVAYAVSALNSTNAESAARIVSVYGVDMRLAMNESAGTTHVPIGRYFDNYHVTLSNLVTAGVLPLRQFEARRTSSAGPYNLVSAVASSINPGDGIARDLAVPCATDNTAQTIRLRAIQETDVGGSSVIYERTQEFATVQAPGVMMEVSANTLPLAGGLNSFDVRIYNRGYATMYLATTRGNGADPGDLAIVVRNAQGQEVSRQSFNGSPTGIVFSGGVGYVAMVPGASLTVTVPNVLVPEALANTVVTFEAVASAIYDRFSSTGQQQSGPLTGSMDSSLRQTPYFGSAQTDSAVYSNDQPIVITGQALDRVSSATRANVPLKIGFATRGYRWYRDVTTDSSGNYSYTYNPGPGLAGSLTIWAAHPDVVDQLNQAQVTIYRLYASPTSGDVRMSKNDTLGFSIVMFNPGDRPLSNFNVTAQVFELQGTDQIPTTKVTGSLLSSSTFGVGAGQRETVNLQLAAAPDAPNNAIAVFTFTSAEGATAVFTANVTLLAAVPIITVISPDVGYVEVSLDRGKLLSKPVTLVNRGLKDLVGVTLAPPTNETWMVLNLPANPDGSIPLPDLKVGETNTFTVVFSPPANTSLGFHQDKIVVRGTNSVATFDVNLFARITSDQFGAVQFYVDNILGLDVPNATVRLRNTALQIELPTATTDINGLVTITNLQEGDWSWQINAPGHSANVGVVQVIAGQVVQVATRLNKSVVTVNFSVVPVPFTDRYEIRLEQTFETHVPVPVLVMTPTFMEFDNVKPGFEATYIVTAKNEGLIQMENFTFTGSQSANATFTPLITYAPYILPQQTIEIPMHVTFTGTQTGQQRQNVLGDCLPNPLGFLDDIGPFTEGLAALANAEGRCIKDNTLLMCAGAVAMGMKIFGDVTSVLSSVAEQAASYIGCVIGSLLSNLGGFGGGGGGGGGGQQAVQNFTPTGNGCFAAETRVLLADGRLKMISEIKVGDLVKTGTGRNDVAHVAEVMQFNSAKARNLEFTWPSSGRSDYLRTTDEHLFWVDGKGWTEARALHAGDWLLDDSSRPVRITENQRIDEPFQVYTFRLREDPAFYANGILVHDMCGFLTPERAVAEIPERGPPPPVRPLARKEGSAQ